LSSAGGSRRRVLICEDSKTYAEALRRALEHDGEIEVVGVFPTAEEAIAALPELRPDLVTMDLELPGMSGLEAVEQIMGVNPVPILVLSAHVGPRSDRAAASLAAGALDAVHKESLDLRDPAGPSAAALRRRVRVLSGVRVIRHPRAVLAPHLRHATRTERTTSVIGICASTGGPHALATIFEALPDSFRIPILVVQHITAGFTEGFVRWLSESIPLPVRTAEDGAKLAPGIRVAPESADLLLNGSGRLAFDRSTQPTIYRPSADALLTSLAENAGRSAVAIVLTGMGRDGAAGFQAVRAAGGLTIAQDEETSTVFGMPKAALEGGAELVLPLEDIAEHLLRLRPPPDRDG
jgi:two-component system, chemotaxis family, protein-glutamate methylesterase/glutaminase